MKQFIYVPTHLKTKRIMPGHGHSPRGTSDAIPGVNRHERQARRVGWTETQAHRRHVYGMGGSLGLVGAMLVLMLTLAAAMGPNANVLDRPADTSSVELVDAQPANTKDDVHAISNAGMPVGQAKTQDCTAASA
jgi:hypothetical protein